MYGLEIFSLKTDREGVRDNRNCICGKSSTKFSTTVEIKVSLSCGQSYETFLDRATGLGNKILRDKSFPDIDQQTPLKCIQHVNPDKVDSVCPEEN